MPSALRAATLAAALTCGLVACSPSAESPAPTSAPDATAGARPDAPAGTQADGPAGTRPTTTRAPDPVASADSATGRPSTPVPAPPPRTPEPTPDDGTSTPPATSTRATGTGTDTATAPTPPPTPEPETPPAREPGAPASSEPVAPPTTEGSAEAPAEVPAVVSADRFVGPSVCQKCHFKEHRDWKKSPLANAMATLAPTPPENTVLTERKRAAGLDPARDYRSEQKCVRCHTTGFGADGGYPRDATASEAAQRLAATMGSVSCEACHGAGGRYTEYKKTRMAADKDAKFTREELAAQGLVFPTRESCATCHNADGPTHSSDTFDFERDKDRVHGKPKR